MQENRSFDHYFGTFPGADGHPGRRGQPGRLPCVPDPVNGGCDKPFHDTNDVNYGGPHRRSTPTTTWTAPARHSDRGCKMDGFVARPKAARTARRTIQTAVHARLDQTRVLDVMGYHDCRRDPQLLALRARLRAPGPHVRAGRVLEPPRAPVHGLRVVGDLHAVPYDPFSCHERTSPHDSAQTNRPASPHVRLDRHHLPAAPLRSQLGLLRVKGTEPDCEKDSQMTCAPVQQGPQTPGYLEPAARFTTSRRTASEATSRRCRTSSRVGQERVRCPRSRGSTRTARSPSTPRRS